MDRYIGRISSPTAGPEAKRLRSSLYAVFLHGKGIIHGNVAARNVLLSDALEARISGFQTARRILGFGAPEPLHVLPRKWSSPEILTRQTLTPKTDVWSFGILLYELITLGSPPYPDVLCNDILQFLQRGNIQSRPGNCRTHLYGLMRESWRWREGSRPSMATMLSGLVEGGAEADDRNVLRVPELIDPQSYALTTGINPSSDLTAL
uniref:Tyrosine-protein kinase STYK1 n=1 Tax=Callorhinchus milii TaxID=7868 RepID=V9L5D3_CALMI